MDDALIERLAREAGFTADSGLPGEVYGPGQADRACSTELRRFAALVAEECAKAVESNEVQTLAEAAAAIRAKFKERL